MRLSWPFRAGIVLASLLAVAAPARSLDEPSRARAERLVAAGRCDEALPLLEAGTAERPDDARLALLAGQCALRLRRPEQARAALERARSLDAALPDVDLYLGVARFQTGDAEGALQALAEARRAGSTRPELDLYEGLALLELGRDEAQAAQVLERAAQRAPALDPMASYYAGIAWRRAEREAQARDALEKVIVEHQGTEWAEAASRALEGGAEESPRAWAVLQGGLEWDSNVVFRGSGVSLPDEIGDEADFRVVWSAEAGIELLRRGPWTLGARADYFGSAHFDVTDYDLEYPGAGLWVDRRIGENDLVRLDYAFHYGWLGYDDYVSAHQLSPTWFHRSELGTTRLYGQYRYYDFYQNDGDVLDGPGVVGAPCVGGFPCGPLGLDEGEERDRDGVGGTAGVEHTLPVGPLRGEVWGGLFYDVYESKGREYQYDGFGVRAGFRAGLPADLTLRAATTYVYRPFDHRSTYPDPHDPNLETGREYGLDSDDRRDDVVEVDLWLERPITDALSAALRYGYLLNDSNVAVFDYDRHLVGAYLTYSWQR